MSSIVLSPDERAGLQWFKDNGPISVSAPGAPTIGVKDLLQKRNCIVAGYLPTDRQRTHLVWQITALGIQVLDGTAP